jgi:uncharacterized membrane protein (UPF0127 family)
MSLKRISVVIGIVLSLFVITAFCWFSRPEGPLPRTDVVIDGRIFHAEVAKTPRDWEHGLSNRDSLPQNSAMLFVFDHPAYHAAWMKDMKFPLDILLILNHRIVALYENVPVSIPSKSLPLYGGDVQSDMALEINAGLSQKYSFRKGDIVQTN